MFQLNFLRNGESLGIVTLESEESIEAWFINRTWFFPEATSVKISTDNPNYLGYDGVKVSKT